MSTPEDRIKEALEALEAQTPLAQAPEPSGPQAPRRSAPVLSKDMARELLSVPADELTAAICRQSFFEFVKEFWGEIIPEKPHYNWHMPYICDVLQHLVMRVIRRQPKEWDLLLNVPPGTSKSTLVTVMLQPWAWTIDPTLRFITGSYSGDLSTDHNEKSRQIIKSEKYKRLFPKVAIAQSHDNKTHFKSTQNGERMRTSTGGTVMGIHAHVLIMDDPLNPKQAASEKELKAASTFIDETLFSRKVDKDVTPTIIVMQRLHEDDPTGNWLKKRKGQVMHISLPAEITEKAKPVPAYLEQYYEGGLLDPVRMGRNALNDMRSALGSYGYAGQFLQMPAPEDGGIWQRWIKPIPDAQMDEMVQNKALRRFGTDWDLAYTSKDQNSATAFVEAGELDGKMYINDFGCKWFEFPKLVNFMRLRRAPHYIEGKASGKSAKQMLTHRGVPAIEIPVTGGDKIARTRMSTPYAEAGLVYCRESKLEELYEMEKQGILLFPNNSHDDLNDALTQSIQRIFGRRMVVV